MQSAMLPRPELVTCCTAHSRWVPASVRRCGTIPGRRFWHDLGAGVTVGLVALPLAMAFAIASGLTPQAGIYCAIVTGFLISALGGSRFQIGGPTGAFVVVVAGIVAEHGVNGLFMVHDDGRRACWWCSALTGMGTAVKYLPRPVVIGFTNGIAVLIASTQIQRLLRAADRQVPSEFAARMEVLAAHLPARSRRPRPRFGVAALAVHDRAAPDAAARSRRDRRAGRRHRRGRSRSGCVETVGSRFGGIPSGLPAPHVPALPSSR